MAYTQCPPTDALLPTRTCAYLCQKRFNHPSRRVVSATTPMASGARAVTTREDEPSLGYDTHCVDVFPESASGSVCEPISIVRDEECSLPNHSPIRHLENDGEFRNSGASSTNDHELSTSVQRRQVSIRSSEPGRNSPHDKNTGELSGMPVDWNWRHIPHPRPPPGGRGMNSYIKNSLKWMVYQVHWLLPLICLFYFMRLFA